MFQDRWYSFTGYNASVNNASLGMDTSIVNNCFTGFGFSYAQDSITASDNSTKTCAKSSQGSLYGSLNTEEYYFNAILFFACNRYVSTRNIIFGNINRTAKSSDDGKQYSGLVDGGYNFH